MSVMKHPESVKFWNAFSARHVLLWNASQSREDRDSALARVGLAISVSLLGVAAIVEIAFLVVLLWHLVI
jgi:hypothetical protein